MESTAQIFAVGKNWQTPEAAPVDPFLHSPQGHTYPRQLPADD